MLGKAPNMSMNNFPKDVWMLHRKLVHRYLRFKTCFNDCLEDVPEYIKARERGDAAAASSKNSPKKMQQIICLLSDSASEEESHSSDESES